MSGEQLGGIALGLFAALLGAGGIAAAVLRRRRRAEIANTYGSAGGIVYTIFQWDEGQFHFEESSLPEKERITVDLRPGGRWELTMVRHDGGGEFSIGYEILEVQPPSLLLMRSDPIPNMPEPTVVAPEPGQSVTYVEVTVPQTAPA